MRYFKLFLVLILISTISVACKLKKEMTLEDYAKIESEINLPDPDLDPKLVESVVKKYGYTFDQYKELYQKVEKDEKLRVKLGELSLKDKNKQLNEMKGKKK